MGKYDQLIQIKENPEYMKEIEEHLLAYNYNSRTDFIRSAIRLLHKIEDIIECKSTDKYVLDAVKLKHRVDSSKNKVWIKK